MSVPKRVATAAEEAAAAQWESENEYWANEGIDWVRRNTDRAWLQVSCAEMPWQAFLSPASVDSALEPRDLLALRGTCSALSEQSLASFVGDLLTQIGLVQRWHLFPPRKLWSLFCSVFAELKFFRALQDIRTDGKMTTVVAGSHAVHRMMLCTPALGGMPGFSPGDLDVFVHCTRPTIGKPKRGTNLAAVVAAAQALLADVGSAWGSRTVAKCTNSRRGTEHYPEDRVMEVDDGVFVEMDEADDLDPEARERRRQLDQAVPFPYTYPRSAAEQVLRRLSDEGLWNLCELKGACTSQRFASIGTVERDTVPIEADEGCMERWQAAIGQLPDEVGAPRAWNFGAVLRVKAERKSHLAHAQYAGWTFPPSVNIIEIFSAQRMSPSLVIDAFDMSQCAVAMDLDPLMRPRFLCSEATRRLVAARQIQLTRHAFAPLHKPYDVSIDPWPVPLGDDGWASDQQPTELMKRVKMLCARVFKYEQRGFVVVPRP